LRGNQCKLSEASETHPCAPAKERQVAVPGAALQPTWLIQLGRFFVVEFRCCHGLALVSRLRSRMEVTCKDDCGNHESQDVAPLRWGCEMGAHQVRYRRQPDLNTEWSNPMTPWPTKTISEAPGFPNLPFRRQTGQPLAIGGMKPVCRQIKGDSHARIWDMTQAGVELGTKQTSGELYDFR